MPEWTDEGLILSIRPHGERNAVASLLTMENGRHSGLVYAYNAASKRGIVQIGNLVQAQWRARLSEQLGTYQLELVRNPSAVFLDDAVKLAGLSSCCAILDVSLPEREPNIFVWQSTTALINIICLSDNLEDWLAFYVKWEMNLLDQLGFGLNLQSCAVSGLTDALIYVSPRSGRAVHRDHAGDYADRLLHLPCFLLPEPVTESPSETALLDGLTLTGHFVSHRVFSLVHKELPVARLRLAHLVSKRYNIT